MGHIGWPELLMIVGIIMILSGSKKLPEIARSIGKAIQEFRKVGKEIKDPSSPSNEEEEKSS